MKVRDVVVVGASAGGLTALRNFVSGLPKDFKGYIFIVLHVPSYSKSKLPDILNQAGPLKALHPRDGDKVKPGMIFVAPSDHHLLVEGDKVLVKKGPKENRFRPSIDALFRSAAFTYGNRVIGIVLSGILNDGTSGLWSIKRLGGLTIIQEPGDAEQPQMPENVLEYVEVDHIMKAGDIGPAIAKMVTQSMPEKLKLPEKELKRLETEVVIATRDNAFEIGVMEMGELTPFTCPACNGSLVKLTEGSLLRFRCHTGHAYTANALLAEVSESVDKMLWQSMRGMEEMNMLLNDIGDHFKKKNNPDAASVFHNKALDSSKCARTIHKSIFKVESYSEDIR